MITQSQVSEALQCALENGYNVRRWTPRDIALDLLAYCGEATLEELMPLINVWLAEAGT
jgi:hypothetical protein